jgi:hypothetical protein
LKYLKTSLRTYNLFVSENNTDKLSKNLKLHTTVLSKFLKIDEVFDKNINLIEDKDFYIKKYKHEIYNEYNYIYTFKIKNVDYRLDFVILKEEKKIINKKLKNKKFVSVSFSLKNINDVDYDTPTKLNNQYGVLNYIIWLVNHFKNKINENYIFMFGNPKDDRKFNIYEYIILKCFKDYEIIKDYTSEFYNTNVGYYLIKNEK